MKLARRSGEPAPDGRGGRMAQLRQCRPPVSAAVTSKPLKSQRIRQKGATTGVNGQEKEICDRAAAWAADQLEDSGRVSEPVSGYHLAGAQQRSRRALHSQETRDRSPRQLPSSIIGPAFTRVHCASARPSRRCPGPGLNDHYVAQVLAAPRNSSSRGILLPHGQPPPQARPHRRIPAPAHG